MLRVSGLLNRIWVPRNICTPQLVLRVPGLSNRIRGTPQYMRPTVRFLECLAYQFNAPYRNYGISQLMYDTVRCLESQVPL